MRITGFYPIDVRGVSVTSAVEMVETSVFNRGPSSTSLDVQVQFRRPKKSYVLDIGKHKIATEKKNDGTVEQLERT